MGEAEEGGQRLATTALPVVTRRALRLTEAQTSQPTRAASLDAAVKARFRVVAKAARLASLLTEY